MVGNARNFGIEILNGNIDGDETGKQTSFGQKGDSVIDYIISNAEGKEEIKRMEIVDRIESAHMPLEQTLNTLETPIVDRN